MDQIVSIRDFSKSYGKIQAVKELNLSVSKGQLFGLIGPDGAGKTTTMRTLVTLLRPDTGTLVVNGFDTVKDVAQIRKITGYMPQRFSLYPDLSVNQNLDFFAELFEVPKKEIRERKERLYKFSRLEPFKDRLAGKLSGGMKQKLALSCTLIHNPALLVLDEPTTGVDPVSRNEFWTILRELKSDGVTILVSTPYMDEAGLCDQIAVMHEGLILLEGDPAKLPKQFTNTLYAVKDPDIMMQADAIRRIPGIVSVQSFGDTLHITVEQGRDQHSLQTEFEKVFHRSVPIVQVDPSLEDLFIHTIEQKESHGK